VDIHMYQIRQCIWDRIQFENEVIPDTDALYRKRHAGY